MDRIEEQINRLIDPLNQGGNQHTAIEIEKRLHRLIELVAKEAFQAGIEREHNPFDNPNFDKWFNQVSDNLNLNE